MGIQKAYEVLKPYLSEATVDLDKTLTYDLAIDGTLFLYTGLNIPLLPSDEADDYVSFNESVGRNAAAKLETRLDELNLMVRKCSLYFDGKRPHLKQQTSMQRSERQTVPFDRKIVTKSMIDYLKESDADRYDITVIELDTGEAENVAYADSDDNFPTIVMTDDSDLFHLAYGNGKKKINHYMLTKKGIVYDLTTFVVPNMKPMLFKLLMFMLGSDFTETSLTPTMFACIASLLRDNDKLLNEFDDAIEKKLLNCSENELRFVCNIEDVELAIVRVLNLLAEGRTTKTLKFTTTRFMYNSTPLLQNHENYTRCLVWCMNYSIVGASVMYYDNIYYATKQKIDVSHYYAYLLLKYNKNKFMRYIKILYPKFDYIRFRTIVGDLE